MNENLAAPGRRHWQMITVVGADRPGIVAALTRALFQGGCNLGEASMVRLGGNFTIMLMVEGTDPESLASLVRPVADALGLRLHIDPMEGALHRHAEPNVQVTVHGADRPGIVAEVSGVLAAIGFNILDLTSDVGGAQDKPFYVMVIDGVVNGGAAAVEQALAPVRAHGVQIRVADLDTLVG